MAFYKMEKLTQIDLSNNWLTYVDPYIFTDLSTPEWTVDVTTNPFICDCGIEGKSNVNSTHVQSIFRIRPLDDTKYKASASL